MKWFAGWFLLGSVLLLCAIPLAVFAKRIRVASYKEQNILQQATRALRNGKNVEKSTSLEPLQAAATANLDEDDVRGKRKPVPPPRAYVEAALTGRVRYLTLGYECRNFTAD